MEIMILQNQLIIMQSLLGLSKDKDIIKYLKERIMITETRLKYTI